MNTWGHTYGKIGWNENISNYVQLQKPSYSVLHQHQVKLLGNNVFCSVTPWHDRN